MIRVSLLRREPLPEALQGFGQPWLFTCLERHSGTVVVIASLFVAVA